MLNKVDSPLRDHKLGEPKAVWSDSEIPAAGNAYALKVNLTPSLSYILYNTHSTWIGTSWT